MSAHLGPKPGEDKPEGQLNERNGASSKTVLTEKGAVRIEVLRNMLNKSVRRTFDWKSTMNQFAILYGERFTLARN